MYKTARAPLFCGAATALATPFCDTGIDLFALEHMIEHQIQNGIQALVICGTTGEAPLLDDDEYAQILSFCGEKIAHRVPFIAGCGASSTAYAIRRARIAAHAGADGLLLVTPYYSKGTAGGLVEHFHAVADATSLPILLYHIPGRTGVRLSCEQIEQIVSHPRVVGIKEASGDLELFMDLAQRLGHTVPLYTGCDSLLLPSLALGGAGVISVVSNLRPKETQALCRCYFENDTQGALHWHAVLFPLIRLLFAETNPAPLKCALSLCGQCEETMRLPLAPVEQSLRDALRAYLDAPTTPPDAL